MGVSTTLSGLKTGVIGHRAHAEAEADSMGRIQLCIRCHINVAITVEQVALPSPKRTAIGELDIKRGSAGV
jgi:hypothetical protein